MPLDKNLTGEQIQHVLDLFLYKALEPIVLYSDAFDAQVSYVLYLVSSNRKRKPSSIPRESLISLLCSFMAENDRRRKFEILREAKLERSFLHIFAKRYLERFNPVRKEYAKFVKAKPKNRLLHKNNLDSEAVRAECYSREDLFCIINISNDYLAKFYEYRSLVLDHYIKLASRHAHQYIKSNGSNFEVNEVKQIILRSILLAIDKYDSNKGAFTSYINWWILNAQTSGISEHEYGIAYTIPQSHRKRLAEKTSQYKNYSISLDDAGTEEDPKSLHNVIPNSQNLEDELESEETEKIVQQIVKSVDTRGCARLILDIGEHFTKEELDIMRQQTLEEVGNIDSVNNE